jgi:class 3 adenylate cyclase
VRAAYDEGRLYRFRPGADVVSLARKITILFADLRGFTKTAEGAVSERELTDQLYRLFDPIAGIVERYGGRVDKFTGDGVMITFGFDGVGPQDEANGLRAALAIQARVQDLRAEGRTDFEMGISVHTGRAQIAHFILNDREMDHTVIGRSANLAGRLSGSGKLDGEVEEAAARSAEGEVRVDPAGTLYNSGVAVSQDTVEALAAAGEVEAWHQGQRRGFLFADAELAKNLLLEYVGDAKFRGVGRAIAIYRLGPEGASQPRGAQ